MSNAPLRILASLALAVFASVAAAQGSPHTERPASAPFLESGANAWADRQFDLIHIDGDLVFDLERRQVKGRVTNVVDALTPGLREISLDAEGLRVSRASVNGATVTARSDGKKLVLTLVKPTQTGERLELAIDYECNPVKGLHWGAPEPGYEWKWYQCYSQGQAQDNHFWLPTHDYPNDRATWRFTYRVPKDLTAVGNGKLESVEDDVNTKTRAWRYSMDKPNCTYLISVAIGPWEKFADDWKGVAVEYFVARGQGENRARLAFGKTPEMIEFFSQWIEVPYPWVKYSQTAVMEFVVGGMENVSATTQTDTTLHDEKSHLERDSEGLVSHELAHQWWGDLVTCNGWRHLWLNEGFATYFTALWFEHSRGLDDYRLYMDGQRRGFLQADSVDAPRSLVTVPNNRRDEGANAHVYTKGSSVLHMLRFVIGDDNFRRSISLYARRYSLELVETRQLERVVADVTGRGLEWFWQEWVYLQGAPSFEVKHEFDAEKQLCQVYVKQVQAVSALVPIFKMPVDILFAFADGALETKRVWVDSPEQRFEFAFPTRPLFVRFDEGSWLACRVKHERTPAELRGQAQFDPDAVGRREACERLGEWLVKGGDAADADPVVETLALVLRSEKEHRDVRMAAAAALKNSQSNAAVMALTAALQDPLAPVRRVASDSLASSKKNWEAAKALLAVVKSDKAYGPRAAAIRSLGEISGPDAWNDIAAAAGQPSEREVVKIAALETLRKLDATRAVPLLLDAAKVGQAYESRERALGLLTSIAADEASKDALGGEALAQLAAALRAAAGSNNWRFRQSALRNLGQLDDAEGEALLQKVAKESRDPRDTRTAEASLTRRKARREKTPR